MATNPGDIQLNEAEQQLLATIADKNGRPWGEVFRAALAKYGEESEAGEVDLEAEYQALFPDGAAGQKPVSLERVRQLLSQVSGSLASDINADRCFIARLTLVEVQRALARRLRTQEISVQELVPCYGAWMHYSWR